MTPEMMEAVMKTRAFGQLLTRIKYLQGRSYDKGDSFHHRKNPNGCSHQCLYFVDRFPLPLYSCEYPPSCQRDHFVRIVTIRWL